MSDFLKECQQHANRIASKLEGFDDDELREYLEDYLDIEYIVNANKEYQSARIYITLGGPCIYIDTEKVCVKLNHGATHVEAPITYNTRDRIDDIFSEIYGIF